MKGWIDEYANNPTKENDNQLQKGYRFIKINNFFFLKRKVWK